MGPAYELSLTYLIITKVILTMEIQYMISLGIIKVFVSMNIGCMISLGIMKVFVAMNIGYLISMGIMKVFVAMNIGYLCIQLVCIHGDFGYIYWLFINSLYLYILSIFFFSNVFVAASFLFEYAFFCCLHLLWIPVDCCCCCCFNCLIIALQYD